MNRAEKHEFVTHLSKDLSEAGSFVVAHYSGLTVLQMNDLRSKMRETGGSVKVAKNRLAKIALRGTVSESAASLFNGQTLIVYSSDPITAPKVSIDFAKAHGNLVILGGAMGATCLDAEAVKSLASLPTLDELRSRLVGMLTTPATRIARIVKEPASRVARVVGSYSRKDEAA